MGFGVVPVAGPDIVPDSFSFTTLLDQQASTVVESEVRIPLGYNALSPISVVGGEYQLDGGSGYTSASGTISPGQSVQVRHTTGANANDRVTTTLTIGGVSADFESVVFATSTFAPPVDYNNLVTQIISMAQASANNLAAGSTPFTAGEYANTATRSTFYGLGESLRSCINWALANGYTTTDLVPGMNRAIAAYITIYGRAFGLYGGNIIFGSHEVPYYALRDGLGGGDITVTETDVINETLHFNFESQNKFHMGTAYDINAGLHGFYTSRSRPVANKAKAFIYHEKQGLGEYIDPIQGGAMLPAMEDAMVTHCYRWRNEFQNYFQIPASPGDRTAPFMIAKSLDTMAKLYDHRVSQGQDPNLYFPSQVSHGDLGIGASVVRIANPYTGYLDCMADILLWLGRPAEGNLTLDTTPYDGLGHAAEYLRVVEDGGGRVVGDPMMERFVGPEGEYVQVLYRNGNTGVYTADNIQMMNVHSYFWLARKLNGVDNVTRDRLIRMGNAILYGAVQKMPTTSAQKARNQTLEGVFKALNEYSLMSGVQY